MKGTILVRQFHSGRLRARARIGGVISLIGVLAGLVTAPAAQAVDTTTCQEKQFPVSVLGTSQTMAGTLCAPPGDSKSIHVLIPGGFYNRTYWDVPIEPETRSFRQAMNKAGYATLVVDRLGTGSSSKPPSVLLTAITQANAVHQVVQALRAGSNGPRFDKVFLGGHSLGSAISVIEAATYKDVDGVLVTGLAHRINVLGIAPVFATFIPAVLDRKFIDRGLDLGYLTTGPGTRFNSLHAPGPYNAAVERFEESTKDVAATTELVDAALVGSLIPITVLIDVPVMLVMGSNDPTLCGLLATDCSSAAGLKRSESPFYSPAAKLRTHVVQGYGHSINYAPNAPDYHRAVVRWANEEIGR